MKTVKLYQVIDLGTDSERFCFNARNEEDAKDKLMNWLSRHNYLSIKYQFKLNEVPVPEYAHNIHNEWVN